MTRPTQVLIQYRENGYADHRHGNSDLQGLERDIEQQECAQARTDDSESDRRQQAAATEKALPDERQGATDAHKRQRQHIRYNRNVGFDAQGNHDWNCDQRGATSHDADDAREEEHSDQDREFGPWHATMIARPSSYNVGAGEGVVSRLS